MLNTKAGSPFDDSDAASLAAVLEEVALGTGFAAGGLVGGGGVGGGGGGLDDDGFVGDSGRLTAGEAEGDFGADGGNADSFVGGEIAAAVGVVTGGGPTELGDFCLEQLHLMSNN